MTPAATIVATAIAFGLFHVIAPNPLASAAKGRSPPRHARLPRWEQIGGRL